MGQELKYWVFMPAGAQEEKGGGRPQCTVRLDLLRDERTKQAEEAGIGFGIELKGPAKAMSLGWTTEWIDKLPYTVHMGNEDLSVLYAAEEEGDTPTISKFMEVIRWLASLDPKPLSVGLHGARLNVPVVNLDSHRFDWRTDTDEFLALQDWHGGVIKEIIEAGLTPAIETVPPSQFVGPPLYGKDAVWVPMTYHEGRIGAHPVDLCYLRDTYGGQIWLDFEHLFFGLNFLNRQENYSGLPDDREWAKDAKYDEFVNRIGYAAKAGLPPISREPMSMEESIRKISASHIHVGGSLAEVVDIGQDEPQPPREYIDGVARVLDPYPYMYTETVGKRVGSHDSIYETDEVLEERMKVALECGAKTFLVETSGYTSKDCWYWAKPDALEFSFFELLAMLQELI